MTIIVAWLQWDSVKDPFLLEFSPFCPRQLVKLGAHFKLELSEKSSLLVRVVMLGGQISHILSLIKNWTQYRIKIFSFTTWIKFLSSRDINILVLRKLSLDPVYFGAFINCFNYNNEASNPYLIEAKLGVWLTNVRGEMLILTNLK